MLDKTYESAEIEAKHYRIWEESGAFSATPDSKKEPFTIMMPPPNVTGRLHVGHALNMGLQDILARYYRMKGRDVLWQPGTDHASIATHMVVEKQLAQENLHRQDLGRDAFVERVWKWKEKSGNTITKQLRRLGASPDWARERFTMDEGLSKAVIKVFVQMQKEGLIYRDKRLVNWDPKLQTAISNLEIEQREHRGHLWHFKYPIVGMDDRFIIVATTRPETMFGDTAVAVHPDDERYKDLIGKEVVVPLIERTVKIIADSYVDPAVGTGAVKITPAHDTNDFEMGKRHDLEMITVLDHKGCLNDQAPERYQGLDRHVARDQIITEMQAAHLLEKAEPHNHPLPFGDRSGVVIEPLLMDQWYVNAEKLAGPAIEAVEKGDMVFVPKQWENTYFTWMKNIQPWCISRQLWWGHRIPAWYAPDGTIFVEETEQEARDAAKAHFGKTVELTQDEDVLDTWFSSGLWPFSTLGWPEKTKELERYYPGQMLITGFDIIFFWVARMMMMGLYLMKEVPFKTVYIHALVRDEKGQKMSKSKGNIVDPLELIEEYGADAVRFTLAAMAAQGRDIRLATSRVEGYRNFCTKLWNAARYCEMNACYPDSNFDPLSVTHTLNHWIISEVAQLSENISTALESSRFNDAAQNIYRFAWGDFCDWYLEFTKPILDGDDEALIAETKATTGWVFDKILHFLHPMMPFVTEELFEKMADRGGQRLISASWPEFSDQFKKAEASKEIHWLIRVITAIRRARADMQIAPSVKMSLLVQDANKNSTAGFEKYEPLISSLSSISAITLSPDETPSGCIYHVLEEMTLILPIADVIDLDEERARLIKESRRLEMDIQKFTYKLGNKNFLRRAPEFVIQKQRSRLEETEEAYAKLKAVLENLK